jgi:hypothetical protein
MNLFRSSSRLEEMCVVIFQFREKESFFFRFFSSSFLVLNWIMDLERDDVYFNSQRNEHFLLSEAKWCQVNFGRISTFRHS